MALIGYHNDAVIPFAPGDRVTIPAGTKVHCRMYGDRVLSRCQTVTVNHTLPGRSVPVEQVDRDLYPAAYAETFARYDELQLDADTNPDRDEARGQYREARELYIHIANPSIRWPGKNGYWCEVDVNDILADTSAVAA